MDAIAGALTGMLEDAAQRDDLRVRGPLRASRFSWERTASETLDVYRRLDY
ncbi:MAG: hypothetical protein ACM3JD_12460 [Rudaea sp.]